MADWSSLVRFVVYCFFAALSFSRCDAKREAKYSQDSAMANKKMEGDKVLTYHNISSVTCAERCTEQYPCGGFAYNKAERSCSLCGLCGDFRLVDQPGYRLYVLTEGVEPDPADDGLCPASMDTPNKCWQQTAGRLVHVSVGPAGAWGVNANDMIYYRPGTFQSPFNLGTHWTQIDGALVQVDVSTDTMWGVNVGAIPYHRVGISASTPGGRSWYGYNNTPLRWLSVSPGGSRWGRDTSGRVVHLQQFAWQPMGLDIQAVDAGLAGVWVLSTSGQLLHRLGTYGDSGSAGSEWRAVEGTFQGVASGRDLVAAVDTAGQVWLRTGLGPDTPTGLAWLRYPGPPLKQLDVYQTDQGVVFYAVNNAGAIFFSLYSS